MLLRLLLLIAVTLQPAGLTSATAADRLAALGSDASSCCCDVVETTACCGEVITPVCAEEQGAACRCDTHAPADPTPEPATPPRAQIERETLPLAAAASPRTDTAPSPDPAVLSSHDTALPPTHRETQARLCVWVV